MKFFKKRKDITREDGAVYLKRWNLFECKFFSIKLHNILLSDYDCLHDHPWTFISIILWGCYVEHRFKTITNNRLINGQYISKIYHPLNILYRPARTRHRLEIHQPCWSLIITFKKFRMWGFWTKAGWVPHYRYNSTQSCEQKQRL